MAFFSSTAPLPPFSQPAESFRATLRLRFDRYRRAARARRELSALSDRDLADIGVCRADIPDIARETAVRG